jgi:GTP-binding protein
MKIKSAKFAKGIMGDDEILEDGKPQVAFIGRSNVGKSAVINSLVGSNSLAKSSATAGRTKEINLFLIDNLYYLVDLPGYGFAKASLEERDNLRKLIYWYLLYSEVDHKKVVLIIDAKVGPTDQDLEMLRRLEEREKDIIVVANKIDKLKTSQVKKQIQDIQETIGDHKVLPYSAEKKIGVGELTDLISN